MARCGPVVARCCSANSVFRKRRLGTASRRAQYLATASRSSAPERRARLRSTCACHLGPGGHFR
eukprot:1792477-Prymnesium_polylepis.1